MRVDYLEDILQSDAEVVRLVVAGRDAEEVSVAQRVLVLVCVCNVDRCW